MKATQVTFLRLAATGISCLPSMTVWENEFLSGVDPTYWWFRTHHSPLKTKRPLPSLPSSGVLLGFRCELFNNLIEYLRQFEFHCNTWKQIGSILLNKGKHLVVATEEWEKIREKKKQEKTRVLKFMEKHTWGSGRGCESGQGSEQESGRGSGRENENESERGYESAHDCGVKLKNNNGTRR